MTISLRITGKNSDGEYWLHLDGSPQKAGLNLGDPAGMITSALLMAASGHTYIRADAPELLALVGAVKAEIEARNLYLSTAPDRGGSHGPKGQRKMALENAQLATVFAIKAYEALK